MWKGFNFVKEHSKHDHEVQILVMDKTLTPKSMDYLNALLNWTTLKWTTPKKNNPNEYYLKFLAAGIIKLHITYAYVHPVQPLATSL